MDERGGHCKPGSISETFTNSHSRGTCIGHVMKVIREELNARLGSQECQNLVIYNGKEEKETDKMSLKKKVGAEFPGRELSPTHDPEESLGTTGKRFCR